MTYERIMGIDVTDEEEYQKYRNGMIPILESFGGKFGFDFKVSDVLITKSPDKINRVFTIEFPSQEKMEAFFSNPDYLAIKKRHYYSSVKSKTVISLHHKNT